MPVTSSGRWFSGPEVAPRAALGPKIYGTTTTEDAFDVEDALAVLASVGAYSFLRTAMTGSNNDIDFVSVEPGDQTAIGIEFVDPSDIDQDLAVVVVDDQITVNLKTNHSGTIVSTAAQVVAAVNHSAGASVLVHAAVAPGNSSGAGVVTDEVDDPLIKSSGMNPTADVTLEMSVDGETDFQTVLTIPQMVEAHDFYKRMASVAPGGKLKWKVTVTGTSTPLLAIGAVATTPRSMG